MSVRRGISLSALAFVLAGLLCAQRAAAQDAPANPMPTSAPAVAEGNVTFAFDLYKELARDPVYKQRNILFSPYSLASALTMLAEGAQGRTAEQIGSVLNHNSMRRAGDGPKLQTVHEAFAWTNQILKSSSHANPAATTQPALDAYELAISNSIAVQQRFPLVEQFSKTIAQYYGAGNLQSADFSSNPEIERAKINAAIASQTNQKIKTLLPPGAINPLTRMLITNAVYFKGAWQNPFKKAETKKQMFRIDATHDFYTETMHAPLLNIGYGGGDQFQAIALPYRGNDPNGSDLAMLVLLPDRIDGLPELERSLLGRGFYGWLGTMQAKQVEVFLPRFRMNQSLDLQTTLSRLGMPDAFEPTADFSGISAAARRDGLHIQTVLHQALAEVSEEGTEAAAATAVAGGTFGARPDSSRARPIIFRADHPFIFMIYHYPTGSILFMGRVINPAG